MVLTLRWQLLEGLQSSLIISKIPSASHEKGHKNQNRNVSRGWEFVYMYNSSSASTAFEYLMNILTFQLFYCHR